MRFQFAVAVILCALIGLAGVGTAQQTELAPQAKVAALSDFSDRVRTLEQLASDIALAASLAVLTMSQPDLHFESEGKWSSKVRRITNDLGGVTGSTGYALPKMRGKLVKSPVATEVQIAEATALFEGVQALIVQADALNKLVAAGDPGAATDMLRNDVLSAAQDIRARADVLSGEVQVAIKLAGI